MKACNYMVAKKLMGKVVMTLLIGCLGMGGLKGQAISKPLALELGYDRRENWFSGTTFLSAEISWRRGTVGVEGGRPYRLAPSYEVGMFVRYPFLPWDGSAPVMPFVSAHATYNYLSNSGLIEAASRTYNFQLHAGAKLMLWNGIHLMGESGVCVQKMVVPSKQSFFEDQIWVRPSLLLGLGYTLRLRPWTGFKQRSEAFPVLELQAARHTVSLRASRALFFIFPPTIEYRVDYGYALKPRWDVYGGIEFGVSRWFFPTDAGRDSVRILGGRVGGRFFPLGKRRLSYYADGSVALGRRLNGYFLGVGPRSKNLQAEIGSGVRLGLYKGVSADVLFFRRWFWVFPGSGMNREGEAGVVFGLSYRFGG